jgi:hypothetical protein
MLDVALWFGLANTENDFSDSTFRNGMFIINVETLVLAGF